jgi:glyoxylase-like metal-dependent hydrolase (beta-lactamase superfamily II)
VRVLRVLAPNPGVYTLEGTNTWIVGDHPAVVIDPGPDDESHLRNVQVAAGEVAAIFVTHGHPDHAPGAIRLSSMTGSPILAAEAASSEREWRALSDGDQFVFGETRVAAVHTPGHTPDHFVFLLPGSGALFTGDMVLGRGTSVIDPPEGELAQYLKSLARMQALKARVIYPGHGPVVFDARGKLAEYVAHRAEREEQILAAVAEAEAPASIDDLVAVVYSDYPEDVRPLAARSVLAHLDKLAAEDRVEAKRSAGGADRYSIVVPKFCARCGRRVRGKATLCGRCSLAVLQEGPPPQPSR